MLAPGAPIAGWRSQLPGRNAAHCPGGPSSVNGPPHPRTARQCRVVSGYDPAEPATGSAYPAGAGLGEKAEAGPLGELGMAPPGVGRVSASREPASSSGAGQAGASSAGSGSGRSGPVDSHIHIAAQELQRGGRQEPRCQSEAFASLSVSSRAAAEREQNRPMPRLKPPAAKRTPATARRCRYSHGLIRRLITVTDREGVALSSGACIGMPPAAASGCPVTYQNDIILMGGPSRAALAVRLGAEGSRTGCTGPFSRGPRHAARR